MPPYRDGQVSLAFDHCGCPNRCRHCWLGQASSSHMDLGSTVEAFRNARAHVDDGRELPHVTKVLYFGGHVREPHFCPNYREVREVELELNGGVDYAADYELLSVWRLARDQVYARWAREIGVRKCQVSLAGVGDTNDWFYRRKGAHADIIRATLRLIEHGIQPRWQIFLTRMALPDLAGVLQLVDELRLRERVSEKGAVFEMFLNDPTPLGEAGDLQEYRLTLDETRAIPQELVEATVLFTGKPMQWRTEAAWIDEMLRGDELVGLDDPNVLWFYITPDWCVYANIGSLEPWWRIGQYRDRDLTPAFRVFLNDGCTALREAGKLRLHEAARTYGDPHGDGVYLSGRDLRQLWLERHSMVTHQGERHGDPEAVV